MAEVLVGKIGEFSDGDRKIVSRGKVEVGVFRWDGKFFAYSNICLHSAHLQRHPRLLSQSVRLQLVCTFREKVCVGG